MNILDTIGSFTEGEFRAKPGEASDSSVASKANMAGLKSESNVQAQLLSLGAEGGRFVFAKSIEANFSLSISYERPDFEFKPPSPADVAKTVLDFVERRIDSEVRNGADDERVSDLLNQARKGVEAGFSSAMKDIESLDLMDEELEGQIGESRSLIDKGIDKIEDNYLGEQNLQAQDTELTQEGTARQQVSPPAPSQSGVDVQAYEFFKGDSLVERSREAVINSSAVDHKFASSEKSEFSLQTRDGDIVKIRFSETFASVFRSSEERLGVAISGEEAFEFVVEGELDEGEIEAINNLLSQVGEVSELFFQDRFQDAFVSALSIGFDSSEIAAFSLDLSKTVVEELRTYGEPSSLNGGDLRSIQRYQPLVDMTNYLATLNETMESFEAPQESMTNLIKETLERVKEMMSEAQERLAARNESLVSDESDAQRVSISQFVEFTQYILLSESA